MRWIIIMAIAALSTAGSIAKAQSPALVPRGNEQPSFDCATATTAAARLICADAELARLDRELGVTFLKHKIALPKSDQIQFAAEELAWIRDRNERCGLTGKGDVAIEVIASSKPCLVTEIRTRIESLSQTIAAPLQLLPNSLSPVAEPEASSPKFDANQAAALLDKRDPAQAALQEIQPSTSNGNSRQILAELNSMGSPDPAATSALSQYTDLANCASSARKNGSTSPVGILQNECAPKYRDWFSGCSQVERSRACALTALLITRMAMEGYDQYCVNVSAQEYKRFECDKVEQPSSGRALSPPTDTSSPAESSDSGALPAGIILCATLIGLVISRRFRKIFAAGLFIAFGLWATTKMVANNDYDITHLFGGSAPSSPPGTISVLNIAQRHGRSSDIQRDRNKWIKSKQAEKELSSPECHKDGDVITVRGVANAQSLKLANGSLKDVWLLVTDHPICLVETDNGVDAPHEVTVSRIQIIGEPPPLKTALELKGKLSTDNITQYYAVPTAISVISGRRTGSSTRALSATTATPQQPSPLAQRAEVPLGTSSKQSPITECDTLAANPIDLQRRSAGFPMETLRPEVAIPACEAAVRQFPNSARLIYQLGRAYQAANNMSGALEQYHKAANQNYPPAQYNLGLMYSNGLGVSQDYQNAAGWYRKAAEQGLAVAQLNLGLAYETGQGVPQDFQQAASWYGKAAEQEEPNAKLNLATLAWCIEHNPPAKLFEDIRSKVATCASYGRDRREKVKATERAQLQYKAEVDHAQQMGYQPTSIQDFKLDGKRLAATHAKLFVQGFYKKFGGIETLLPNALAVAAAREYGNDGGIPLMTDDATRNARKVFLECGDNPAAPLGCSITVVGHATMCTQTTLISSQDIACLAVDDIW